jgi:4-hydroxy-tetrahydrodipicolinate synthase
LHPGAIQVILPDWSPVTDDEIIAYLSRVCEAANGIGIVLYNPPHAKRVLPMPVYARLHRAVPGLVGVKVCDGTSSWYGQMREFASEISVFVSGHHLATGFQQGAAGAYSNVACLHPAGAQRWWQLMHDDLTAALELERRIVAFFLRHIIPYITEQGYVNSGCDKLLAAIGDWADVGTRLRWPYRSIPQEDALRLRPIARQMLPELFP